MSPQTPNYIPVGCIAISRFDVVGEDAEWHQQTNTWNVLQNPDNPEISAVFGDATARPVLDPALQQSLLKAQNLRQCAQLFHKHWILLEFRLCSGFPKIGVLRVYLLADDALRGSVDRTQKTLVKARDSLLTELDCSDQAWAGIKPPLPSQGSLFATQNVDGNETSLLELFNGIPSPAPDVSVVTDPFLEEAMTRVLRGDIPGLKTELLPYQQRSVAFMLQKEMYPGQVLDPRLLHLHDRAGQSWYFDPVALSVFRDPKYYDGVSGGILAEEMGTGKTIICLALILATRSFPSKTPEVYWSSAPPVRKSIGSLMDMAAACATRHSQPWRSYYGHTKKKNYDGLAYAKAIQRNPGSYLVPSSVPRRCGRISSNYVPAPKRLYTSSTSLVIVPNNLLSQWKQEVQKHTDELDELDVLVLSEKDAIPDVETLLEYDVLLFSQPRFEKLLSEESTGQSALASIHFKRCIVDEGHILGNSTKSSKSSLLTGLQALTSTSRWIVTGTPSRGLYGTSNQATTDSSENSVVGTPNSTNGIVSVDQPSREMERKDLEKLKSIAELYLKAQPWANSMLETEDRPANWRKHFILPENGQGRPGRLECLKLTIGAMIVRHRSDEVLGLLPAVDEKIVLLDGSYQDMLSLNVFAMMIIFNAVQSQRTDRDYFFHSKQKKSLLQIVHNMKQSSFFGGSFFTADEIAKAVQTAEEFLEKKEVETSVEDEELLKTAIDFGHLILTSSLRSLSNQFHEMPICVSGFPGGAGKYWSLDGEANDSICTSASMIIALQKLLYETAHHPEKLNSLLNGGLIHEGMLEREKAKLEAESSGNPKKKGANSDILAGNTKLGDDSPKKSRSHGVNGAEPAPALNDLAFSAALAETKLVSTVSAKLSYIVDSIVKYQYEEKIIIFYENENVAWYLASVLDMVSVGLTPFVTNTNKMQLQVQHRIYAKGLSVKKRAKYVDEFHDKDTFRYARER